MNRGRVNARRPVVIVPDDACVITHSKLAELYDVAGDLRTLGEALGLSASTLSRALSLAGRSAGEPGREQRLAAVRAALDQT